MQLINWWDFVVEVNFEVFLFFLIIIIIIWCIQTFFSTLKWHPIYQNWPRHSNFTTETGLTILIFSECFHLYLRKPTVAVPSFVVLHHIDKVLFITSMVNLIQTTLLWAFQNSCSRAFYYKLYTVKFQRTVPIIRHLQERSYFKVNWPPQWLREQCNHLFEYQSLPRCSR